MGRKKFAVGLQKKLSELFKVQRSLSPEQMRKSLGDSGMDLSVKVTPSTPISTGLRKLTPKSELIPRIYWSKADGGKYKVHYLPPNTKKLIVGEEKVKIDKHFENLIEQKTKFYNEGEKFSNYLDGDLKPYSSAKELAMEELTYIPVRGERAAKKVFPDIIKDLGSGYYSTYSSGLKEQVIRSRDKILGKKMKPLSYLGDKAAGSISFSSEQKRRKAHKALEDFLRKSEKNKRYDSMQLAEMEEFKDVVPEGSSIKYVADTIRNFRQVRNLEKTVDPSKLNPFGLTIAKAGQFHKSDPQLQGLFSMAQGKGPLGVKFREMLDRYLYPYGSKKLARLHDVGFQYNPGRPPQALSTPLRNNVHTKAETRLRFLDDMIEQNPGDAKIKEWKTEMKEIGEDMELLGLQSDINGVVYGKWYAKPGDSTHRQMLPFFRSLKKGHPLKRLQITGPSGKKEKYKHISYDEGGLVNGYSRGGKVKKLLDDTLGMMSRRKFLKGMGATAASTAMPKGLLKAVSPTISKGAMNFAPPWVNGLLSSLKSVPNTPIIFKGGNNADIKKIGSRKIKLYGGKTGTESHYQIKTSDQVKAEEMVPKSKGGDEWWDDIVLREEPGETTITWKNKMYDHGNDQHIVIDTKNKETRFIDDNWHMEAGGEDIAKDDWIEWSISSSKEDIAKALKKPVSEIDDRIVDGFSMNDMDNSYSGMFQSYVDSFSPSGNVFGTVARTQKSLQKKSIMNKQIKDIEEEDMMNWEDQFRGGKGIHGYYRGGTSMRDYPQQNKIAPKPKPPMRRPDNWNMENVLDSMGFVESTNRPNVIGPSIEGRKERAHGMFQIMPSTARKPGYGVTPWTNFSNEWRDPIKQRDFAKRYLQALVDHYEGDWFKALSQYGGDSSVNYWNKIVSNYNKGGIARRPNAVPPTEGPDPYATFLDDSVSQVMNNPSEFMGTNFIQKFNKGGYVKKNAPKVIGMITNYKPKLTMAPELKKAQPSSKPWAVFDEKGNPIKDFRIKKEAESWWHKEKGAAPIGDDYYTKTLNYKVGKKKTAGQKIIEESVAEQPGAMFWGSREKIIGAPSEAMTGKQWLQYMKIGKHGILNPQGYPRIKDMELNDTSLAPWLSRMGNKTVSKEALVKQFDEMAPTMDVTVLGESTGGRIIDDLSTKLRGVDTQAIRNPAIKGFFDYVKTVLPQLKESTTDDAAKGIVKGIDDMVLNNFGVKDALTEGVPQRFPFEMKEVLQQLSTALGKRTAGFKTYTRSPQHRGTQMMDGGDNYREFLFKYKPGSLRQNEPSYQYAHDFNLSSADRAGGVVHTRTSDRADQFGRRLLHIEEIQSDMHQHVNAAQRQLKRKHADWAKEGKTPEGEYKKMSKNQKEDYDKLVAKGKYAPRGDLKEEIGTANEQHFALVKAKIEDLLAQPQTKQTVTRLTKLKKERTKIRKLIDDEKKKMAEGNHSGIPQGPLSKTEDYNEFVMKYLLKVAREGGYDGISINTPAIKNKGLSPTNKDFKGNLVAYGPMAQGAMKKAANKSGANFMKTVIVDDNKRVWEVPMILFKENKGAQAIIDKGLPIYKRGGIVKK